MSDQDGTFSQTQSAIHFVGDPWREILPPTAHGESQLVQEITEQFQALNAENARLKSKVQLLVQTVDAVSKTRAALEEHIEALSALCDIQRDALSDARAIIDAQKKKSTWRWPF